MQGNPKVLQCLSEAFKAELAAINEAGYEDFLAQQIHKGEEDEK